MPVVDTVRGMHWATLLVLIWAAGVLVVFVRMAIAYLGVDLLVRRAVLVDEDDWHLLAEEAAREMEVTRRVRLRWSSWTSVPLCVGIRRPVIVLPLEAHTWSPTRRKLVLLHELAHVKRRDCLTQLLAHLACAVYWPNPLAWVAARNMRVERERACDDLVLLAGIRASEYAETLLESARRMQATRWTTQVALAMARPSQLEGRLLAILDTSRSRQALNRVGTVLTLAVVFSVILPLATLTPASAGPEAAPVLPVPPAPEPIMVPIPEPVTESVLEPLVAPMPSAVPDTFEVHIDTRQLSRVARAQAIEAVANLNVDAIARQAEATALRSGYVVGHADAIAHRAEAMALEMAASFDAGAFHVAVDLDHGAHGDVDMDAVIGDSLSIDQLIALRRYGVDAEFIRGYRELGFDRLTLEDLTDLAKYGADPEYADELRAAGFTTLRVEDIAEMAKYGLDAELVAALHGAGYDISDVDALVDAAKYGVDEELLEAVRASGLQDVDLEGLSDLAKYGFDEEVAEAMARYGYATLSVDELIELSKYGVDLELVEALQAAGYTRLSPDDLVDLSKYGVDGDLIEAMRELGYTDLTADDLIDLSKYGVDPDFIRTLGAQGYDNLPVDDLVDLSKYGVDSDYIEELAEQGYERVPVDELIEARKYGVDMDLAETLSDLGLSGYSLEDLARLSRYGVDGEYVRELREAGLREFSVDQLIEMRKHGVDGDFIRSMRDN